MPSRFEQGDADFRGAAYDADASLVLSARALSQRRVSYACSKRLAALAETSVRIHAAAQLLGVAEPKA